MPSSTLHPSGADRSKINLQQSDHFFGITSNLLSHVDVWLSTWIHKADYPPLTGFLLKESHTTLVCSSANFILLATFL